MGYLLIGFIFISIGGLVLLHQYLAYGALFFDLEQVLHHETFALIMASAGLAIMGVGIWIRIRKR